MPVQEPNSVVDGFVSLEGGVHSGRSPSIINRNQVSFAVNTRYRGGFPRPRPGFNRCKLVFQSAADRTAFQDGHWQGAQYYFALTGAGYSSLIASIEGRIWKIEVVPNAPTCNVWDISITGDPQPATRRVWMEQADMFLVIQDGQSLPLIYDGVAMRRATDNEVPVGTIMAYGNGRLWVTRPDLRSFWAGDLIYTDSGSSKYHYADALLKNTENTFLAEGGEFGIPVTSGEIKAMRFLPTLDTSLGQGPLQVLTTGAVFSVNAPFDRTTWADLEYPIQTISLINYGATSHNSTVTVNGDLWYRSQDGIRSFIIARRDFASWGNTPMSTEMNRVLTRDDISLLDFSSALIFDNRLLMTSYPIWHEYGVYNKGLIALDFDRISAIGERYQPSYDGLWTGLNILQLVKGTFGNQERAFAFVRTEANHQIELWEISRDDHFDNRKDRIQWTQEFRSMDFDSPFELKQLDTGDLYVNEMQGRVDFDIKYREDKNACWHDWYKWNECATFEDCGRAITYPDTAVCDDVSTYREQYRSRMPLPRPTETSEPFARKLHSLGFEFQPRLAITGYCQLTKGRFRARLVPEQPIADLPSSGIT